MEFKDIQKTVENLAFQYFLGNYKTKENTTEQGKKVKYAVYSSSGRLVGALSEETYNKFKTEIDAVFSAEKAKREKADIESSWVVKALSGEIITQVTKGEDYSLYALTAELPKNIWNQIKQYTEYIRSDEDMEGGCDLGGENYRGWTIAQGAEKILVALAEKMATPEHRDIVKRLLAEKEEAKARAIIAKQKKQEKQDLVKEIIAAFDHAEYPEGSFNLEGERVEDPFYPQDIYGGGRWFVIEKEYLWFVKNNGHDGDDWSRNNIQTGGAGAIGTRIKYNAEIAEKIRELI